jgi:tetrahydromethanopterin S-methyltransferase subunit B
VEGADDLEVAAGGEPCLQEVLLVPELELVAEPGVGVVVGGEDVVDVDQDAGAEAGEELEVLVEDVAARADTCDESMNRMSSASSTSNMAGSRDSTGRRTTSTPSSSSQRCSYGSMQTCRQSYDGAPARFRPMAAAATSVEWPLPTSMMRAGRKWRMAE